MLVYLLFWSDYICDFILSEPSTLPLIFSTWLYHFAFFFLIVFFLMVFIVKS